MNNKVQYKEIEIFGPYAGFYGRYLNKFIASAKIHNVVEKYSSLDPKVKIDCDDKGGCIIFPQSTSEVVINPSDISNLIKENMRNLRFKFKIGNKFDRDIHSREGECYGKKSLAIELNGVNLDSLIDLASELSIQFGVKNILLKDYYSKKVFLVGL